MMRVFTGLLLTLLLLTGACWAQGLNVEPAQVHNGELALVRWSGEVPSFGVVRFNGRVIYFSPDRSGATALLPVGLETPAGRYPLLVAIVDHRGRTTAAELNLEVVHKNRPLERLTLPEEMVTPKAPVVLARISRERTDLNRVFEKVSLRHWTGFSRPVDDPVNSVFGKRRLLNGKPRAPHSGTDFRSPAGTPVRSIGAGTVVLVDDLFYTGKTVVIDHGDGLFSLYAHLSASATRTGARLEIGEVIGHVGNTGRTTGPHLHLTVRLLGERVDPMALLALLPAEED